jgi:hypothetical protein
MALRGYHSQFKHGLSPELQKERHEAYVREKLRREKNKLEKSMKSIYGGPTPRELLGGEKKSPAKSKALEKKKKPNFETAAMRYKAKQMEELRKNPNWAKERPF